MKQKDLHTSNTQVFSKHNLILDFKKCLILFIVIKSQLKNFTIHIKSLSYQLIKNR